MIQTEHGSGLGASDRDATWISRLQGTATTPGVAPARRVKTWLREFVAALRRRGPLASRVLAFKASAPLLRCWPASPGPPGRFLASRPSKLLLEQQRAKACQRYPGCDNHIVQVAQRPEQQDNEWLLSVNVFWAQRCNAGACARSEARLLASSLLCKTRCFPFVIPRPPDSGDIGSRLLLSIDVCANMLAFC